MQLHLLVAKQHCKLLPVAANRPVQSHTQCNPTGIAEFAAAQATQQWEQPENPMHDERAQCTVCLHACSWRAHHKHRANALRMRTHTCKTHV